MSTACPLYAAIMARIAKPRPSSEAAVALWAAVLELKPDPAVTPAYAAQVAARFMKHRTDRPSTDPQDVLSFSTWVGPPPKDVVEAFGR